MMIRRLIAPLVFAASAAGARAQGAPPPGLVVVELFQSQGCSSCPPAEANLNALAGRPGVLALSFGVTYWDQLGWKDTFAAPEYTERQWAYARRRGRDNVWTPQVYVNGRADLVGNDRAQFEQAVAQAEPGAGPAMHWEPGKLALGAGAAPASCEVWLVRYDPRTLQVAIGAGENGGRRLPQRNVVRQLVRLGRWDGAAHTYALPGPPQPGLATAALVQAGPGGEIVGAGRQDAPR